MLSVRQERAGCPLYTAIGVIEGRWKVMLFQRLLEGPCGFGALHRRLPGVSRKVLAEQLRQMECDDLLVRREIGDRLGSVQYELTPYGATLEPVFRALWEWGTCHLGRAGANRGTFVRAPRAQASRSQLPDCPEAARVGKMEPSERAATA
jgi:DNA-binding HxlR family transcriptional regulator